jgi:L-amino acid N-acyltransferase YncA
MTYRIRPSTLADAAALGRVHARAWRESYAGIVPESVLATAGSVEMRTAKMRAALASSTPMHGRFLVETDNGRVAGFGDCGPPLEVGDYAPAEIYRLYLLHEAQGRGLGPRLFLAMLKFLAEKGFTSAAGKIFNTNRKSRRFFEHCGGQKVGEMDVELGGMKFPTTIYLYPELKKFIAGSVENLLRKT